MGSDARLLDYCPADYVPFDANLLGIHAKDDIPSMEHPLFALKAGERRIRCYNYRGTTIEIQPGALGQATIFDKDVWIYCISQLVAAIDMGRKDVGRTIHFIAHDLLKVTKRGTGGRSYKRLHEALKRLRGTSIITNIKTGEAREARGFGLIDEWKIIERDTIDGRLMAVSITLPEWLWRSVKDQRVVTLHPEYFDLRKALHRRIYELARKHCGYQPRWEISLSTLHYKSGSAGSEREFRRAVQELATVGTLLDYRLMWDEKRQMVMFYSTDEKGTKAQIEDMRRSYKAGGVKRMPPPPTTPRNR